MSDPAILDSRSAWLRLALTLGVSAVGSAGLWLVVMILPAVQDSYGVSRGDVSLSYTITMAGFGLGSLLLGRAVDRYSVAPVLLVSGLAVALGYALATRAESLLVFSICQFLIGVGGSVCFGPLMADISHWFLKRRGIAVATVACGNYLAGAVWPFSLRGLLDAEGWRAVYLFMAVVTLITVIPGALALRRQIPDAARAEADTQASARRVQGGLSARQLQILLIIAGIACCTAMAMPQVHIVALCVDLGFGDVVGAEMLSLMLAGGVVSRLVSGYLADRIGGVWTLLVGSVLQGVSLFLFLPTTGIAGLYVVSLVFGLAQGGIVPSYAVIIREYLPAREAGARVGQVVFATIIGMAGGGWMAGWIFDQTGSYTLAFVNGIGWNVLNLAIIFLIMAGARGGRERGRQHV